MTAVLTQFKRAKLTEHVERFPAVDALKSGFDAPGYSPHEWRDRWALMPTEQAVFTSHRELWKQVLDGPTTGAVICEDDILISSSFSSVLEVLDIERYGIIKLDGFSACRRYGPEMEMGKLCVRDILEPVPSAACYAISKAAAHLLLEDSRKFCATVDDFLFASRKGVRPVQLFPAISVQGMCIGDDQKIPQSIALSERNSENVRSIAKKGPFVYRLSKELRRTSRKLSRILWADRILFRRGGVQCRPYLSNDLPKYKT